MKTHQTNEQRRTFLIKLSLGLGGLAAALASVPVLSALLAPLLEKVPDTWRKVGTVNDFDIGVTRLVTFENAAPEPWAGVNARTAVWLRRDAGNRFTAFSANCTHLGCPVRWVDKASLFMCPCHGGVYYKDGSVAAGPPPKPLTRYQVRVHRQQVEIKTRPLPITNISA
jgi:menaquinol-cytochrome c reductase iron-sulfur subunit